MKTKVLNGLLILTSLFGYLEWGNQNHVFLFQVEGDIIYKLFSEPSSVMHPFVLLPLFGQLSLIITLFQKIPHKRLTYFSIVSLGILPAFMFIIGILSFNLKISLSVIPYLVLAIYAVISIRKIKS